MHTMTINEKGAAENLNQSKHNPSKPHFMNRKILLTATAIVLAALGVFAHAKNSKQTTAAALYVKGSAGGCTLVTIGTVPPSFITAGINQCIIRASNGVQYSVWSTDDCSTNKVYFIP
jgi:hypothetical protein